MNLKEKLIKVLSKVGPVYSDFSQGLQGNWNPNNLASQFGAVASTVPIGGTFSAGRDWEIVRRGMKGAKEVAKDTSSIGDDIVGIFDKLQKEWRILQRTNPDQAKLKQNEISSFLEILSPEQRQIIQHKWIGTK